VISGKTFMRGTALKLQRFILLDTRHHPTLNEKIFTQAEMKIIAF
jgi:hypothetical protein